MEKIVNISYLKILLKNWKYIKNRKLNHEKFRRKVNWKMEYFTLRIDKL